MFVLLQNDVRSHIFLTICCCYAAYTVTHTTNPHIKFSLQSLIFEIHNSTFFFFFLFLPYAFFSHRNFFFFTYGSLHATNVALRNMCWHLLRHMLTIKWACRRQRRQFGHQGYYLTTTVCPSQPTYG